MSPALALAGWVAAVSGALSTVIARRALGERTRQVARACHELRGPITAARLGLELGCRRGSLPPARLRALDLELGRATLAIEDLAGLDAPRRSQSRWEELDLRGLLSDSVEAWRGVAEARGVGLTLTWAGPPALVLADRLRLAQATGNLIANALEHGRGSVQVSGLLTEPASAVRIEFTDAGPGLPAPITELARRGRLTRGPHGHGIAVANAVALAHGGRLAAAPSERGARIVLELPTVVARLDTVPNFGD